MLVPADLGFALTVAETGTTYLENARFKAAAYFGATQLPTIGEDSGLEIAALDGAPGIMSARFEGLPDGPLKNARILDLMADLPPSQRTCRYRCAIVLLEPCGLEHVFEGACVGRVAAKPSGGGGFGFDPIVFLPRLGRTLAQLADSERLLVNHRGRAVRKLVRYLARPKRNRTASQAPSPTGNPLL